MYEENKKRTIQQKDVLGFILIFFLTFCFLTLQLDYFFLTISFLLLQRNKNVADRIRIGLTGCLLGFFSFVLLYIVIGPFNTLLNHLIKNLRPSMHSFMFLIMIACLIYSLYAGKKQPKSKYKPVQKPSYKRKTTAKSSKPSPILSSKYKEPEKTKTVIPPQPTIVSSQGEAIVEAEVLNVKHLNSYSGGLPQANIKVKYSINNKEYIVTKKVGIDYLKDGVLYLGEKIKIKVMVQKPKDFTLVNK